MLLNITTTTITVNWLEAARNLQPLATIIIACVAIFNLYTIREFQKQNHRPIISAFIRAKKSTNKHDVIEMIVKNSGDRPATEIRIVADEHQIRNCVHESLEDSNPYLEHIFYVLSGKSVKPLIVNGEEDVTDFFYSTDSWDINEKIIWKRRFSIPIKIFYKDLDKNKYESTQALEIG